MAHRQRLLRDAGFDPSQDGHSQLLASLDEHIQPQIRDASATAEAAIERCRHENQSNATVLQRVKNKADRIKSIIAGEPEQSLYGAQGKATEPRTGRALGSVTRVLAPLRHLSIC